MGSPIAIPVHLSMTSLPIAPLAGRRPVSIQHPLAEVKRPCPPEERGPTWCTMNPEHVNIAVLSGGDSAEREISIRSGRGVLQALLRRGWHAKLVEVHSYDGLPQRLRGFNAAFNILHGGSGEDGTVQLLLELAGIPYVGSGPVASAKSMDKAETHCQLSGTGIRTPRWCLVTADFAFRDVLPEAAYDLPMPAVVKPRRQGSSIGLHMVKDTAGLPAAVREVARCYGDVLVEEFIPGRELTVAVLDEGNGPRALPVVELIPRGDVFDFSAKYDPGHCRFVCPAELSPAAQQAVQQAARQAHSAIGCRDLSRVDLRLPSDGPPVVLELNTLPGMTEMSTFPRAAAAASIPYDELVERLLLRAIARLPQPSPLG